MVFALRLDGSGDLNDGESTSNFKIREIEDGDFDRESYITGVKDEIVPCASSSTDGCIHILYYRVSDTGDKKGLYYLIVNVY